MPELPEVHTTAMGLNKRLKGLTIEDAWISWPRMIRRITPNQFKKAVIGTKILGAERRGKNILISLSNDHTLIIHMKMTGHLMVGRYAFSKKDNIWKPVPDEREALHDPFNRFVRIVFVLSNKEHLVFCDTRKFGRIALADSKNIEHDPELAHLGPEPLSPTFTLKIFKERLFKKSSSRIKPTLMDQRVLVGVGNIYSDEMLFRSGIHPEERIKNIPASKWPVLFRALRDVLKMGIHFGGDSTSDYRNIDGERGQFQARHMAYRRTNKPCLKKGCGGIIVRKVVAGRSAHFCSQHQKLLRP